MQWFGVCGLRLYGIGESHRKTSPVTLRIPVCCTHWDNNTGYCCLATGQCLLCNSPDCGLMRQTDASWNILKMNHKLFWHLCLPFIFTLQMKRQKAFPCTEWDCALISYRTGIFCCFSMWYFCFLPSGLMFLIQICYLILNEKYTFTIFLMRTQSSFLLLGWPLL